jgi:D-alanyl-D-alanine carboxypeptidase
LTIRTLLIPLLAGLSGLVLASGAQANPSLLIDMGTGQVIESQQPFQRWYPASLTKLMTAYVAFRAVEAGELEMGSPVRISKRAAALPPSKMGYKPGSELTLDNAIKIIMVKSANDVAASIGESVAGTQAAFAERMNAESRRLGMRDSHWVNQHGLHDEAQYTSSYDMALLAMALRRDFPQHSGYFNLEGLLAGGKDMPTHNNLVGRFQGADGMKTGYICPSGFNLVASASRNGRALLAVVLGGESVDARDEKAAGLLARGFASPASFTPKLTDLQRPQGAPPPPVSMQDALCSKEAREARVRAAKELAEQIKAGLKEEPKSAFLTDLDRPRRLVTVGLGNITGPMSKAMAAAQEFADVPIPTWRPDLPPPTLAAGASDVAVQ